MSAQIARWLWMQSWQLVVVFAVVAVAAWAGRRLPAWSRYALWSLVLLKILAPPTWDAPWGAGAWGVGAALESTRGTPIGAVAERATGVSANASSYEASPPLSAPSWAPDNATASARASLTVVLVALWFSGSAAFAVVVIWRYAVLIRALGRCETVEEGPLRVRYERLAMRLAPTRKPPELLLSSRTTSPFLCGLVRPRVVLPSSLPEQLGGEEIDCVLLHELMHWRRRDLWVAALQVLAQAVFWFHPAVWAANYRMREEREKACDESALDVGACESRPYGESLLQVLMNARGRSATVLGFLGIFERHSRIQERLEGIMSHTNRGTRYGWMAWLMLVAVVAVFFPLAPVVAPAAGDGEAAALLANADFEKGGDAPADWQEGASVPGVRYLYEKTGGRGGGACVGFEKTANRFFPIAQWVQGIKHDGKAGRLQAMVYVKADKAQKAIVDAQFIDGAGKWTHKWLAYIGSKNKGDPPASHDWRRYNGVVDIPAGTREVRIALQDYGPGRVLFDDVQIIVGSASRVAAAQPAARPGGPPRIVETTPAIGAAEVDPSLSAITVTFDQDMATGMSWTGGGEVFPKIPAGKKPFWRDKRTCVLPVQLQSAHYYRVGINSGKRYSNFRSASGTPVATSVIYFATKGAGEDVKARLKKPAIVSMEPANGARDVSPSVSELRITFDIPMGGGMSWTGGGERFPQTTGKAHWTSDRKTCIMPVKLKPNHAYRLGINSYSFKNFMSASGVHVDPVTYAFHTAGK